MWTDRLDNANTQAVPKFDALATAGTAFEALDNALATCTHTEIG